MSRRVAMRTAARPPRGFTLVEVLVALVIVAVAMSALLGALTSATDTTVYLREKSFAEWVALNRIAQVRLQLQRPEEGKTNGESELAGRRWRWEQEVQPVEVPGMLRIDVRVQPADAARRDGGPWLAQASGIVGDALALPRGDALEWVAQAPWDQQQGGGPDDGAGEGEGEQANPPQELPPPDGPPEE